MTWPSAPMLNRPCAEPDGDAKAAKRQRNGSRQRFGDCADRSHRSLEEGDVRQADRIGADARSEHDEPAEYQRDDHRQHGHEDQVFNRKPGDDDALEHVG